MDRSVARVIVSPTIGTMQADERIDFLVFGRNNSGDSIGVEVSWSATGGQVTTTGQFSAPIPGIYWIVARSVKQPDKADSAQVLVAGSTNPIDRLVVNPKVLSMRVGQSRLFAAAAYYSDGTQAPVPVYWSASGGAIDANGVYTADEPGDQVVIAVVGSGLVDTALVRVSDTPILTSLEISPVDDTLNEGAARQYLVEAYWSDGSSVSPAVDFSTTGGLIDSTGLFVAAAPPGDYLVTAAARGGNTAATSRVRIRPDDPTSLTLSPPSVALTPGASHRFSATAKTNSNRVVSVSINWQATGGTITTNGTYTAGAAVGTYRVIATQSGGSLADTSVVVISTPTATLTGLTLTPGAATLASGEKAQFLVVGTWSDGSAASPAVTWSATGGSVTAQGDYSAGSVPGAYRVIARHVASGKADTAAVTVTGPRVTGLSVTPATAALTTGGVQQFTAAASWSDGSTATPSLVWSATGGSVTSTGQFTAGTATGTFRVIARDAAATVADTSFVTIGSPAPVLQAIVINPGSLTLGADEQQQFYVSGVWTNGGTAIPSVTWSTNGGSISSTGKYRAGENAGVFRVIAKQTNGTLADTALVTVTVSATLTGIVLTPPSGSVQPGGNLQFAVSGVWSAGGVGVPPVTYSATGGTITSSGLFTAGSGSGTFRVVATQVGGSLADTSAVTITTATPVLTALTVSPKSSSVVVNGGVQFAVTGTWTNGGSGAPSVDWTATGGTISPAGYYTAGGTTGTYRVIAKQSNGTIADTATINVTSSGAVLTSLQIAPRDILVQKGMSVDYSVTATWSDGSTTAPPVIWAATGGTISSSGRYVAGNVVGEFPVHVRHQGGTLVDTTHVRVMAPTVTRVDLNPGSVALPVGGTQQFAASATWSDGVVRPVAVSYTGTGGSVSANGYYSAGAVAGSFLVMATCSCGKGDSSGVSLTTSPTGSATLVSMSITPSSAFLSPGGFQQFNVSGQWSDGSSAPPQVTYSTNGGTVSSTGAYTAPGAVGSYRVVATQVGGTKADTALVSVSQGATGAPWIAEDFSSYTSSADLLSYPSSIWSGASEDVNPQWIKLDPSGAPVGGQSMRYDIPAKSLSDPNLCHDRTIGRNVKFPNNAQEIWVEVYVKFSANFQTMVPNGVCGSTGTGYKFIFGRYTTGSRFDLIVGPGSGMGYTFGYPGNEQWVSQVRSRLTTPDFFDGLWHVWRLHFKSGPTGRAAFSFDGRLIQDTGPVSMPGGSIYGLALARNLNQGPLQNQEVNWGRLRVWNTDPGWGW
ncbi:MAG: beta strand repeat-containing protein [Gemmatimonadales bacterium]